MAQSSVRFLLGEMMTAVGVAGLAESYLGFVVAGTLSESAPLV
jgi:hypothetical protein